MGFVFHCWTVLLALCRVHSTRHIQLLQLARAAPRTIESMCHTLSKKTVLQIGTAAFRDVKKDTLCSASWPTLAWRTPQCASGGCARLVGSTTPRSWPSNWEPSPCIWPMAGHICGFALTGKVRDRGLDVRLGDKL